MSENNNQTKIEKIELGDLQADFLNLRIGEEIPYLQIRQIRKVINSQKADNLPGVDYKYLIETVDNKILKVNSWVLWKRISSELKKAGNINSILYLRHNGFEDYSVRVI